LNYQNLDSLIQKVKIGWAIHKYSESVLISKQVLLSSLQAEGFDAQLVNLTKGDDAVEYGKLSWGDSEFTKVYLGKKLMMLTHQLITLGE